jgi:hypothetical protein
MNHPKIKNLLMGNLRTAWFYKFQKLPFWETINFQLVMAVRELDGRESLTQN